MIDLVGKRYRFLLLSLLIIVPGLIAILSSGIKLGIDFTGGTRWEVRPASAEANNTESFKAALARAGYANAAVKGAIIGTGTNVTNTIIMDLPGAVTGDTKSKIENELINDKLVVGERVTETVSLPVTTT